MTSPSGAGVAGGSASVPAKPRYDVVIAGGGLAGLCLAIHLKRRRRDLDVLVLEKSDHPRPEAAHKVGESSVEIASLYFLETLGVADLLQSELRKFGLRFFMKHGGNREIETRLECGPSHFLTVPSYQIDRGQFENALSERACDSGVEVVSGGRVRGLELASGDDDHSVQLDHAGTRSTLRCRWVVDGSGRAAWLKKRFGLARTNRHRINAAWFRIDAPLDIDAWSSVPAWRERVDAPRRLSTNHLMGTGYWVWLIPLAKGRTSVGIVADDRLHPFAALSNFEKALGWLDRHEPQCAEVVRSNLDRRLDFRAIKNYSYDATKMFSPERWCLIGDAGIFVDPLYSPGSDFIAIANTFVADVIVRDHRGEPAAELANLYDGIYRSLTRTFLVTYHRQYPLMGNPRAMTLKVVWDFVMYWGGVALICCRGRLLDLEFLDRVRPLLGGFAAANVRMQAFFREWDAAAAEDPALPPGAFVDYAEIPFLAAMNRALRASGGGVEEALELNLRLASEIQLEIHAEVSRHNPKLTPATAPAATRHLHDVFARLYPEARARTRPPRSTSD